MQGADGSRGDGEGDQRVPRVEIEGLLLDDYLSKMKKKQLASNFAIFLLTACLTLEVVIVLTSGAVIAKVFAFLVAVMAAHFLRQNLRENKKISAAIRQAESQRR